MTTCTRTDISQPVQERPAVLPIPLQMGVTNALLHELCEDHTIEWVTREITHLLDRHHRGDWGNLDPHDIRMNQLALATGDRVLSVYEIDETAIYVITDAGHQSCMVMRREDY
jgi:hypothetical protein